MYKNFISTILFYFAVNILFFCVDVHAQFFVENINSQSWVNNKLGEEKKVLHPWTPIILDRSQNTIKCWGREYIFKNSYFPEMIISENNNILSNPAKIKLSYDGRDSVLKLIERNINEINDGYAVEIRSVYFDNISEVGVYFDARIDFDGLMLFKITVDKVSGIDSLVIEIPFVSNQAVLQHRWSPTWGGFSKMISQQQGVVEKTNYIPYYWIGDNERGLFWFCESDKGWPNAKSSNAIEIENTSNETIFRLNIVNSNDQIIDKNPLVYVFGLQATPIKEMPSQWRKLRLSPFKNPTMSIIWPEPNQNSLLYYGYPEASNGLKFSERMIALKNKRVGPMPYVCLTHLSTQTPEWKNYGEMWKLGLPPQSENDVAKYGGKFVAVSPTNKEWSDFIVWKTHAFLDKFKINNLYLDNTFPYPLLNNVDKKYAFYPILDYRNLYKRVYSILKMRSNDSMSIAHMSGKMNVPVLAYVDAFLNGEQFRGKVKDDYLDVMSLEMFRAEFVGSQWGLVPVFLPAFKPPYSEEVIPTRGMMTLLMLHDVLVWPIWCNVDVVEECYRVLNEFKFENSEFISYYDHSPVAISETSDVYVSAYVNNDKVLLVVGNIGKLDRHGIIKISSNYASKISSIQDYNSKVIINLLDDMKFKIYITSKNYNFIVLNLK